MDQHAVPQNISSYEFRLVGDMTLKQFFQLAGGAGVALIFYKTPFPFFIKWPLIAISGLTGVMLAFVPVGGRPFSQWLGAFIKAIYSPTKFVWNPNTSPSPPPSPNNTEEIVKGKSPASPLDVLENQLFSRFSQIFNLPTTVTPTQQTHYVQMATTVLPTPTPPPPPQPEPVKPEIKVHVPEKIVVPEPVKITPLSPTITYATVAAKPATQTANAMPHPSQKNILVGQVTGTDGKPIEGAIIEIVDHTTNMPARALRTNRLGQFQIATPLFAGEYILLTEKLPLAFEPLSIKVSDAIIPPILITPH